MILTNDFHHTRVQVNLRGRDYLTIGQVRRAYKHLCGISECRCSDVAGTRGPQAADGTKFYLSACPDGTAILVPY